MGHSHDNVSKSVRRRLFPQRVCLRKGCEQAYSPQRWNQRYCQDDDCLREVRRWLARKRQRQCRQSEELRQRHCQRERARRARLRQAAEASSDPSSPAQKPARGHAAEQVSETFCDRPGCYDSIEISTRAKSRYCGHRCRLVMRRVLDRERKWLRRNTVAGRFKRQLEYQRQRQSRLEGAFNDSIVRPFRE